MALVLCACVALTSAQFGHFGIHFSDFGASFGAPSFPGYSGFSGYSGLSAAAGRDPRANTGPVLFPPSPSGDPGQSSGVVVGASGYGFVPPGSQGKAYGR
ncbi:unnamed protein product [Arctia plantaginis]|uniref:Uncharacterized protein n=1 Tax=Arctia plantaginis TaxID=874455 RepID=A0A8S0YYS9_ARCPL|nr:unnamed protein product [Arctia plantaginis]CAB3247976.1 unnamed protein product [Arctia plantaginis]